MRTVLSMLGFNDEATLNVIRRLHLEPFFIACLRVLTAIVRWSSSLAARLRSS